MNLKIKLKNNSFAKYSSRVNKFTILVFVNYKSK